MPRLGRGVGEQCDETSAVRDERPRAARRYPCDRATRGPCRHDYADANAQAGCEKAGTEKENRGKKACAQKGGNKGSQQGACQAIP
jgi:hypothetical protein